MQFQKDTGRYQEDFIDLTHDDNIDDRFISTMAGITRSENEFGLKKRNIASIPHSSAKALPEKVFVHVDMSVEHDGEFATAE